MKTGVIKFFNEVKGFGFIVEDGSNKEIFVHSSGLTEPIRQNDKVEFEEKQGDRGMNAINVRKIS